ncbi:MAG: tetratricopeptide repeat protein, partial [Polyangiaceae bacterium]|nr:tetratricopeptide repeat protein [Polyangiaceae bacterium]
MVQPEPLPPADYESLPPLPKRTILTRLRAYFLGEEPTFLTALVPMCFLSMLLYTRHPATNFIFDEQEALLANPYVRAVANPGAHIGWLQAFRRDFWGLTPERTIGSYRPIPDIVWRALWAIHCREQSAFPHAYLNALLHGLNGALLVLLVARWTRDRATAWLAGAFFVATAVVTEAVSGVVGLADVLGGAGAVLALLSLSLPLATMPLALLGAALLGLYSKESALCIVPLVPLAALLTAHLVHPERPRTLVRTVVAAATVTAAFVFYVEMRRRLFPVTTPHELTAEANAGKGLLRRAFAAALRWYAQPMLPHDPLNNPFIDAPLPYRVAGALRVYFRGLLQVVFPWTLSGDYSAPQEPVPARLVFPESVAGAAAMILPLVACPVLGAWAWVRARRNRRFWPFAVDTTPDPVPIVAFALAWIVVSYLPVSNIPVVLPTVRAERFWYFPAIGS